MTSVAEKLQRKEQRRVATKQVRLKLVYVDFWSVVKLSFLIWLCLGIALAKNSERNLEVEVSDQQDADEPSDENSEAEAPAAEPQDGKDDPQS